MKKMTRILSVLAALGICISLCGCQKLDDLRAARASIDEDGIIQLSDGTKYKAVPACEELCPFFDGDEIYIVEEELPLLLTKFGVYGKMTVDKKVMGTYTEDAEYYCRTDVYDRVLSCIEDGFIPEVYGYHYYDYEKDENLVCDLTPAQAAAVEQVYTTQEPEKLPAAATLQYDYRVDLYQYSADHLFRRDTVDICLAEGIYFLLGDDNALYTVPAEQIPVFREIMTRYVGDIPF